MALEAILRNAPDRRTGALLAFLGMLGISTDSLFIRLADTDGFDITFWVGVFSALVLFGLIIIVRKRSPVTIIRSGGWPLWLAGALQAASTCVFVLAVTKTSVSNVVVWVWLFFSEAPTFTTVAGGVPIVAAVLWGTWQPSTT